VFKFEDEYDFRNELEVRAFEKGACFAWTGRPQILDSTAVTFLTLNFLLAKPKSGKRGDAVS
jgi:hypothetical protein